MSLRSAQHRQSLTTASVCRDFEQQVGARRYQLAHIARHHRVRHRPFSSWYLERPKILSGRRRCRRHIGCPHRHQAVDPVVTRQSADTGLTEDEFAQCTDSEVSLNVQRGDPVHQNRSSVTGVDLHGISTPEPIHTTVRLGSEEWHRAGIARFDQVFCRVAEFHL